MKRAMPWNEDEDDSSSSSSLDTDTEAEAGDASSKRKTKNNCDTVVQGCICSINSSCMYTVKSGKQKSGAIGFEALKRHGYKGGLSVLSVPPPKEDEKQDWTWSTGKNRAETKEVE